MPMIVLALLYRRNTSSDNTQFRKDIHPVKMQRGYIGSKGIDTRRLFMIKDNTASLARSLAAEYQKSFDAKLRREELDE